ncbi:hypothetical protein BsIDN1_42580 [Bacillus safensis]|uniref:Uncharacterized protein n=1 Tax=Bacillus safensis TaxID=561879 RepID=A0A5S9MAT0_BACIA|nr:hypothetical protein BsIDN1_42580 [Bacillus safensis]
MNSTTIVAKRLAKAPWRGRQAASKNALFRKGRQFFLLISGLESDSYVIKTSHFFCDHINNIGRLRF